MDKRARVAVACAVAVGALAAGWIAWAGHDTRFTDPRASASRIATQSACAFQPGERGAFRLESSVTARGTAQAAPTDHVKAVLSWEVLADPTTAGEWLLRAALTSTEVQQQLSQAEQRLTQTLDAPFMLRIGSDCRFVGKGYSRQWLPATRRFVASLLGNFEFVVAPSAANASWEIEQTDGMGRYAARYTVLPLPSGETELTKTKTRYLGEERSRGLGLQVLLVDSTAHATLDPTGHWLRRASGSERVRVKAQETLLADLEQQHNLVRDDALFVQADNSVVAAALDWQDPFLMPIPTRTRIDPEIAKLSRDAAMKRFAALYQKSVKGDAYGSANFLAEWLRAHPEEAGRLLDQLRAGAIAEAMRPAVFLALEQCGTPEARAALTRALADKSMAEMDRARAASALSDVPEPTHESAQALVSASRNAESNLVAGTSIRALGHLGERAKTLDPALQGELRGVLQDELAAARSGSRAIDVVDAIGNSGDASFAADLNQRLVDASPSMREHAVRAFRRMEQPDAAPALVGRLGVEDDAGVRTALADTLRALDVREAGALSRGARQLEAESSPAVRAALIRWLGAAATDPTAHAALVAQFRREKDPRVLQLIGRYLPADELK